MDMRLPYKKSKREEGHSWSNLSKDILALILKQLPIADYIRTGCVCISWRSAMIDAQVPCAPQPPWLARYLPLGLIPFPTQIDCYDFLRGRNVGLPLPDRRWRCWGASRGWLFMECDFAPSLCLLNPVSKVQIDLPSVKKYRQAILPFFRKNELYRHIIYRQSVVLSSPPSSGDCICALLEERSFCATLAVCRVGDKEWKELNNFKPGRVQDLIFHKGRLYVAYSLYLYRFDHPTRPTNPVTIRFPDVDEEFSLTHLVESGGELLLVLLSSTWFSVYKLDEEGLEWGKIQSLDNHNHTLFVGRMCSMSISTRNLSSGSDLKQNSIYVQCPSLNGVLVFSLGDGTRQIIPFPPAPRAVLSSWWFMPSPW